ncbi:MAG: c-type cytochrome [Gemmatimonadota bacterium]
MKCNFALVLMLLCVASTNAQSSAPDGAVLYRAACAACHGPDGRGPPPERKLSVPTPDLTDCSFASREPDADWLAVMHQGGPVRAFDASMPAFGEALKEAELQAILDHVRTMCMDRRWPRGELNLPRTFFIEKAYPEDEAVTTLSIAADQPGRIVNEIVYEKRFGPTSQIELKLPFGTQQSPLDDSWQAGLGDVTVGLKQVLHHSLQRGTIFSAGVEVQTPTGRTSSGLGSGTWVFEPLLMFGKAFTGDVFLHLLAEAELPADKTKAEREAGFGIGFGKTWTSGTWGRTWTPMLELLGGRGLESGASLELDIVPQIQISLNTRQHVLGNIGVRLPVNGSGRPTTVLFYVLWDWFDGGLFAGW